ncbi:class I SAM-dependent methyltransferase [Tepidibacillus fermentans]|uniref:Methyltransferase family protein n=1 Tax=Tepidibacillus fermentans TaxID=1281767 RepID=A0A4R3KG87_9BACI|nr:class I SAM-dependent methyltransferase [Tepidibacillus fermentans]TCS82113.1 methyltransferase family protein [Tepidibacillus fermentans]
MKEIERIKEAYAKRNQLARQNWYEPLNPVVYLTQQEKERKLIQLLKWAKLEPLADKKVLEIGCGSGGNLLHLIRLGFKPENLVANELLEERAFHARRTLPVVTKVMIGDASTLDMSDHSFDIVLQSTVFTSILDEEFQQKLAANIWRLVKPGGGILWYDFVYNNPNNPDVKGIPLRRIKELFPEGQIKSWRVTLAPPISRQVVKIHPALYHLFNSIPLLRTHRLCWISKQK